jgi:hypothetical protein
VLGAKVSPLGCSRPLQRAIVDFAADQPFAQARAKLEEHYGFTIGESTIQRITFAHAQAMHESSRQHLEFPEAPGVHKPIVVEIHGAAASRRRRGARKGVPAAETCGQSGHRSGDGGGPRAESGGQSPATARKGP